jgi:hypothetical protein
MPISWRPNGNRFDIVFTDPYTQSESEKAMKEIFARPDLRRPLRFLVDVRHSAPPDVEFVTSAITFWQLHIDKMWGAKVAVVAATDQQARMGHLSEQSAQARQLPFSVRVFPEADRTGAEQWLIQA